MTSATGFALIGSLFILVGMAGVLWRFFHQTAHQPGGAWRGWVPPKYIASWTFALLGVVLIVVAFILARSVHEPAPFAVFVSGISVGLCIATPGLMMLVTSLPAISRWTSTRQTVNPPWRAQVGVALIAVGIVAGGLVGPIVLLTLRH